MCGATIRAAFGAEQPNDATAAAERAVTEAHVDGRAALVARTAAWRSSTLDVVGFHGQTIMHRPERRFTWQIGDGAALARATGVKVVNDLRSADVAAGGQGAPLVPVYHAALARDLPRPLAVVNIGGVGNVTWIGADGSLLAFDTGPGNAPIDDWCARRAGLRFDRDGALAALGQGRPRARRALQRASLLRGEAAQVARSRRLQRFMGGRAERCRRRGDADARHGARHRARGASLSRRRRAMGDLRRRRAQSDPAEGDRRGDARQGGDGRQPRLERRCARGAGLRLPGRALAARPAAQLSRERPARHVR